MEKKDALKPSVSIVVDQNKNVILNYGTMENHSTSLDKIITIIVGMNQDNCYKRVSKIENISQETTTYNFYSRDLIDGQSLTNDVAIQINHAVLDEKYEDDKTLKQILEEQCQLANDKSREKAFSKEQAGPLKDRISARIKNLSTQISENKEKIKKIGITIGAVAGVVAIMGGVKILADQNAELYQNGPYDNMYANYVVSLMNGDNPGEYGPPIEFVREHDEEFQRQMQESKEQERKEEEAMVRAASDTDSMQESQAKGK